MSRIVRDREASAVTLPSENSDGVLSDVLPLLSPTLKEVSCTVELPVSRKKSASPQSAVLLSAKKKKLCEDEDGDVKNLSVDNHKNKDKNKEDNARLCHLTDEVNEATGTDILMTADVEVDVEVEVAVTCSDLSLSNMILGQVQGTNRTSSSPSPFSSSSVVMEYDTVENPDNNNNCINAPETTTKATIEIECQVPKIDLISFDTSLVDDLISPSKTTFPSDLSTAVEIETGLSQSIEHGSGCGSGRESQRESSGGGSGSDVNPMVDSTVRSSLSCSDTTAVAINSLLSLQRLGLEGNLNLNTDRVEGEGTIEFGSESHPTHSNKTPDQTQNQGAGNHIIVREGEQIGPTSTSPSTSTFISESVRDGEASAVAPPLPPPQSRSVTLRDLIFPKALTSILSACLSPSAVVQSKSNSKLDRSNFLLSPVINNNNNNNNSTALTPVTMSLSSPHDDDVIHAPQEKENRGASSEIVIEQYRSQVTKDRCDEKDSEKESKDKSGDDKKISTIVTETSSQNSLILVAEGNGKGEGEGDCIIEEEKKKEEEVAVGEKRRRETCQGVGDTEDHERKSNTLKQHILMVSEGASIGDGDRDGGHIKGQEEGVISLLLLCCYKSRSQVNNVLV